MDKKFEVFIPKGVFDKKETIVASLKARRVQLNQGHFCFYNADNETIAYYPATGTLAARQLD